MAKTQNHPIGNEFRANIVQENFLELFQFAHDHIVRSAFPSSRDGSAGDFTIVDDGTNVYICVKTQRGWFKTISLSAV